MRLTILFAVPALLLAGCPIEPTPCDFPIRCVDNCTDRNEVSFMCGECPSGSVPIGSCVVDGGLPDSPTADVPVADTALPLDAPVVDSPTTDAPLIASQVVSPDCGPADGAAYRFGFFEGPVGPTCTADAAVGSVSFYVHDLGGLTLPPVAPTTITSSTATNHGAATECPGGSPPCRTSSDWTLELTTFTTDVGASGNYTIRWEDGGTTTGNFDAVWCGSRPLCG